MSEGERESLDAAVEIDCRGLVCPLPARETETVLKRLPAGQLARVLCTDPAARIDLSALCARTGDELVRVEERGSELVFWIRRLREA